MREIFALRSQRGPYRFLVRRWDNIADIDLAVGVLGTEFFQKQMAPLPLPIDKVRSILVLAPHQDDEAIGAGGALSIAASAGVQLDIMYLTDGTEKRPTYAPSAEDCARIRRHESREFCRRLGAGYYELGISNLVPAPTVEQVERLADLLHELRPEVVMVPWVLDSPAKHRLANHLLWLADQRRRLPEFEAWGYQVHNTLYPNGYVDITQVIETKRSLLQCFSSQNNYSQCYEHLAIGMAAWNHRFLGNNPVPRYLEVFLALPSRELLRLVESFYFHDFQATYRGDSSVIPGMVALQAAILSNGAANGSRHHHGH